MSRKFKIGITFNLEAKVADIWSNGAHQNMIFLYHLFKASKMVKDVMLVSWGPEKRVTPPEGFMLDGEPLKFAYIHDVIEELDVLIEGTLLIEPGLADTMHKHGGKVVAYKLSNDYLMDSESFLFDQQPTRVFNGTKFDAAWIIPQNMNTNRDYLSIMMRCDAREIPAIWSPFFCDKVINRLKRDHNLEFGYKPDAEKKGKRLACFEPNIYIFKTCYTPILIGEQAYRTDPEAIAHFYACNTYHRKDHPSFFNYIGRTDMVRDGVLTVEGRYQLPDFLTRYVDIVVSHQWENGLNYAYNDALYGGYPFIHNSRLLPKGVGYYYDQFDAHDGARVVLDVVRNHDKNHEDYVKRANEYLYSLSPTNPINIARYEYEVKRLFE